MTDNRALWLEAEAESNRRLKQRTYPAVMLFTAIAVAAVAGVPSQGPGLWWIVGWAAAVATATANLSRQHVAADTRYIEAFTADDGVQGTVVRRPSGSALAGRLVFAAWAGLPAMGAFATAARGEYGVTVIFTVITLALCAPTITMLTGRANAGEMQLTPAGIRIPRLRSHIDIAWDDILFVDVDGPASTLRLTYGTQDITLSMRGWGLMGADLARLIIGCVHDATARRETADLAAMQRRFDAARAAPVLHRRTTWSSRAATPRPEPLEGDQWAPVRILTPAEQGGGVIVRWHRYRAIFAFAVLGLVAVVLVVFLGGPSLPSVTAGMGALATVISLAALMHSAQAGRGGTGPALHAHPSGDGTVVLRRAARRSRLVIVACLGLAVTLAGLTWRYMDTWPLVGTLVSAIAGCALLTPLLVSRTGRWHVGELRFDEHTLTYRSGLTDVTLPWSQVAQVDWMWATVIRVAHRDGRSWRLDVRSMATTPAAVVRLLHEFVRGGGPRGATHHVEGLRLRLDALA